MVSAIGAPALGANTQEVMEDPAWGGRNE
jgi:hypothetical protein